jgi:hypothetical protein
LPANASPVAIPGSGFVGAAPVRARSDRALTRNRAGSVYEVSDVNPSRVHLAVLKDARLCRREEPTA